MSHVWQILPGKLWQADIVGATTQPANCIVTCSPLSEVPSVFADLLLQRPMHVLFPFLDVAHLPDLDLAWTVAIVGWSCLSKGKTVVVNCNEGCNRSGLILGMILKLHGIRNAVEVIKAAHPKALYNQTFVDYLKRSTIGE